MGPRPVFCDYNAGGPLRAEARARMTAAMEIGGNPSSVHGPGRKAKALLEASRAQVAAECGALPANVVFTSGATEALHLALQAARAGGAQSAIVGAGEHDAIRAQVGHVFAEVRDLPLLADGRADLARLEPLLATGPAPALVVLQLANNETGVLQPVREAAALARGAGASLLVDAAQGPGRIGVDVADLDATYLALSSPKVGGPMGMGALVLAPGAPFSPDRAGGGQEMGRRPGTENLVGAAGFAAALSAAGQDRAREVERLSGLRDHFETLLRDALSEAVVFGGRAPRLANTSQVAIPGWDAQAALIALDLAGVAASSGSACSSGKVRQSHVLAAMGVAPALARCALRISFGWGSQPGDPERIVDAMLSALARRRTRTELEETV